VEVGLSAFAMGVNVLEDRFDASTLPDLHSSLMVFMPTFLTCSSELANVETAGWIARGCETETVLVVTALPTGIPLEIIVAAREVSSFIGSKRSLLEEFIGRIGRLIGVTVTDEPPLDGVSTLAVGFGRLSGVEVSIRPPTWFENFLFLTVAWFDNFSTEADDTGELLALLTAADGTFLLVFECLDFTSSSILANFPPFPLNGNCFPFGGEGICLGRLSFVGCVFSLLLLRLFCPLSLRRSPN
jgi:hypothetical protein